MHKASGSNNKAAKKAPLRAPKRKMSKKVTKAKKAKKVMTVAKRFGGSATDAQGRVLPVDYETAHLHDSYDPFYADTTSIFDEHPHFEALKVRFPNPGALITEQIAQAEGLLAQIPVVRASITNPTEQETFDNTLAAALKQPLNPMSEAEVLYELEKRGFKNFDCVTDLSEGSTNEFLFNDFKPGRTNNAEKFSTVANYAVMLSATAFLAYTGCDAIAQYYYDIQYPLHHH